MLYKLGYTKLSSIHERLAFNENKEEQMIDRVLCFAYLPNAYNVDKLLHAHLLSQLAFGKFSALEDMPLFKTGQSELYCEDILDFDAEFSKDEAELVMERTKLARYTRVWDGDAKARWMIHSHDVADRIAKVLRTVLDWTLVYPIDWAVHKAFKIDTSKDQGRKHAEEYNARVVATIERLRQAEAARRMRPVA